MKRGLVNISEKIWDSKGQRSYLLGKSALLIHHFFFVFVFAVLKAVNVLEGIEDITFVDVYGAPGAFALV